MAIALVKAGTITAAAAATVSPAFGQATTSGSLLVAGVGWSGVNVSTTAASGWVKAVEVSNVGGGGGAIWYKANCGAGETAPTFLSTSATQMTAVLSEWSGAATSSPLDQTSGTGNSDANTAADTNTADLAVFISYDICSKSCTITYTNSWTPAGGTVTAIANDGATKQLTHLNVNAYLLGGNGGSAADTWTGSETLSTGLTSGGGFMAASFKPPAAGPTFIAPRPLNVNQSVKRASFY